MIDLYPNETLPIMWVIFTAVLFSLSRFVFKPTVFLIEERHRKTEGLKDEAVTLVEKAKELTAAYEKKIAEAHLVASKERERIIGEARTSERKMIDEARSQNEAVFEEMKGRIEREKKEAELKLKQYAQRLSKDMVDKILERAA